MAGFLGIDHPLIAVRDIAALRATCAAIGFTMTPVTRHPWGTSTSIAVFERSLLELISVYDDSLLDEMPAGSFRFGRTVAGHLREREGISLTALYSEDADADAAVAEENGVASQGKIEFGRDIVLPDGTPDRTATTLRILYDPDLPRVSHFICQQHRPDLIYVPRWMVHANGVVGIAQVTIMAATADQERVRRRLAAIYGADAMIPSPGGFTVPTGNGTYRVADPGTVQAEYGALPEKLANETQPSSVAMHFRATLLNQALQCIRAAGVAHEIRDGRIHLRPIERFANVAMVFESRT